MPTRLEKLEAHASHMLDIFIGLREKFALLEPMLFDERLVSTKGSGKSHRGFRILRHSLFLACSQDIAKLCFDKDDRTPSIQKIVAALEDASLTAALADRFASYVSPSVEAETDPEILEALKAFEHRESIELRAQFSALHQELVEAWTILSTAVSTRGFHTIRDKVSAHTEVLYAVDKYQLVDISTLGILWRDVGLTIRSMQRLIEIIGLLVRGASFAWHSLDHSLESAAVNFWELEARAS